MLRSTLENIANQLLEGKINSECAEKLISKIKGEPVSEKKIFHNNPIIHEEENYLSLQDKCGKEIAYLEFYFKTDGFGKKFIWLEQTESFCEGKGYFKGLFNKLKLIGKKEGASCIRLEVDYKNERAISIYAYLGFYEIGPVETISENIDRIEMRKDI
jgi:hypothetical protein